MSPADGLPIVPFSSQQDWRAWLEANHAEAPGIWMKIAKKASGIATVSYGEAVDVALCFGWIDGQKGAFDGDWFLQRFTPRRARSKWSQVNVGKVAELTERGLMTPAGQLQVDAAKADGRWDAAYAGQATATVPDDLRAALDADPAAAAFFESLTGANRYAILYRVHEAKLPATRARRIEKFVGMCARGEVVHLI